MSIAIDTDRVSGVLLADGWHQVEGTSFDLDSYEFVWGERLIHGGGNSGVCATGFTFYEDGLRISGPLTALLAVRENEKP